MSYLLDTCILSKMRKLKTHPCKKLEAWYETHAEFSYFISALSIGEIQKGISKLSIADNKYKMALENWLIGDIIPYFDDRILSVNTETASIWGELCGNALKKGIILPVIDSLIAASAIQHHLILVTENLKDFAATGVRLFNPCV